MRPPRISVNTILFALTTVAMGFFFVGMPRYVDDLWYSIDIMSWERGLEYTHWWEPVRDTIAYHMTYDTSRLSNILFTPFLLLPKWAGSLPLTMLVFPTLVLMMRMASVSWRRSPLGAVLVLLFGFGLPWYDSIGSECYQFNYIVPMALGLWVAAAALRLIKSPRWLLVAGSVLLGMWHEGFAIPILSGLVAVTIFCHPDVSRRRLVTVCVAIAAGLLWIVLSPSLLYRMDTVASQQHRDLGAKTVFILLQHPLFLLTVVLAAIAAMKAGARHALRSPAMIFLGVSALVSICISAATLSSPRAAWWCDTATIPALLILLHTLLPGVTGRYDRRTLFYAVPCLALATAHYSAVAYWSLKADKAMHETHAQHMANPRAAAFFDYPTELQAPLICYETPDFTLFVGEIFRVFYNMHYHRLDDIEVRFVPAALRTMHPGSGEPLADSGCIRRVEGHMVMPLDSFPEPIDTARVTEVIADIGFDHRVKHGSRIFCTPFTSVADGRRYVYLYPWRCVPDIWLGEIKSITNITQISSCS